MIQLITKKAKTINRPTSDFTIDPSNVLTGDPLFNSTVKAYATAASGLTGNYTFRYNRADVSRMLADPSSLVIGTATTVYGLIATLNAASGLVLVQDDLVDGPIGPDDETVTLTAKSTSWFFVPGSTFAPGKPLTPIGNVITNDTLDYAATPNFGQTAQTSMINALNQQYGISLSASKVAFEAVAALASDPSYNSTINVHVNRQSGYKGIKTLRYNRFTLTTAFNGKTIVALPTLGSTILTSLAAINSQYGLLLAATDVVDAAIDSSASQLTLTAAATSQYYIPGSTFTIGIALPQFSTLFSDPVIRWI